MKLVLRNSLVVIASLVLVPAAWALVGGEGLSGSPHDFTPTGTGDLHDTVAGNEGLCTFCHTPHKAQTTLLLWNHSLSGSTFTWDVAATTAGTTLPTNLNSSYGGVSVKCLSCHDGTVAIGDIAWFKEQAWTAGGNGPLLNLNITSALGSQATSASLGAAGEFLIANGSGNGNLAGNHPVGIPFPFTGVANTYNGIISAQPASQLLSDWQANPLLSTVANIRLFSNSGNNFSAINSTYTGTNVGIECSSCHDPHNKQSVDDLFLRGKITGSAQSDGYICEQCHKKGIP
jgi:Doubled CXXCH motif (Paired_CXXCH_1)